MARRRGWILIALGLVLAVGTGTLVYYVLQQAVPASATTVLVPPTPVPMQQVPLAARDLVLGTVLTDTDITLHEIPADVPIVGIVTDTTQLVGQTLTAPITSGAYFQVAELRGGAGAPLSGQIEPQNVLMAFPVDDLLNKAKVVQEGDHVDLLLTLDIKEESQTETREGKATNITLQNVRVFRIVRDAPTEQVPNPEPEAILLEMKPADAVVAKFIKDSGGTLDFTLRSPLDVEPFNTDDTMVNNDYLFDNYRFRAPRSSSRPK